MKKTGKALSLVLSLALVVSSLTATFASAATTETASTAATVDAGQSDYTATANPAAADHTLNPHSSIYWLNQYGKDYYNPATGSDQTGKIEWYSSNETIAKVVDDANKNTATPNITVFGKSAGTATVTALYTGYKLYDRSGSSGNSVYVDGSASFTVTINGTTTSEPTISYVSGDKDGVYVAQGDDDNLGDSLAANTTAAVYQLDNYTADSDHSSAVIYTVDSSSHLWAGADAADIGAATAEDGTASTTGAAVFAVGSNKQVGIQTYSVTTSTDGKTYAEPYSGTFTITAYSVKNSDGKRDKVIATRTVIVKEEYAVNGTADSTITAKTGTGSDATYDSAYVGGTNAADPKWTISGYDIYSSQSDPVDVTEQAQVNTVEATDSGVTVEKGASVYGTVDALGAVSVKDAGTSVGGNITADGAVSVSDSANVGGGLSTDAAYVYGNTNKSFAAATVSNSATIGGGITAGAVTVSGDDTSVTGDIKSFNSAVSVTGAKVGNISAGNTYGEGNSTTKVNVTKATTGYIYMNEVNGGAVTVDTLSNVGEVHSEKDVTVNSATVSGNVTGATVNVTATGSQIVDGKGVGVDTKVTGDVDANTAATIGSVTATNDRGNITVTGSVADVSEVGKYNTSTVAIKLIQNGTKNKVSVGNVIAKQPNENNKVFTTLNITDVTAQFNNLENFASVTIDGDNADVTVANALNVATLSVNKGIITVPAAKIDTVKGSNKGTISVPANMLFVNKSVIGQPVLSVPGAKKGTVLFSSTPKLTVSAFTCPGFTLAVSENTDKTYSYTVTDTKFAGIQLNAKNFTTSTKSPATITVSAVPADTKLPTGETLAWSQTNGNNFTLTVAKDGMSATVVNKAYSAVNANSMNDNTVTVKVMKSANVQDTAYQPVKATVSATEVNFISDTTGALTIAVGGQYTYKITSTDGSQPNFLFGTSGVAKVVSNTKLVSGTTTYYLVKVEGVKEGTVGAYIDKNKVNLVTVKGTTYKSDTSVVTVAAGKSYTFKITGPSKPNFAVSGFSAANTQFVGQKGNDYFFKITNNKVAAGAHGAYVNGVRVAIVTVK